MQDQARKAFHWTLSSVITKPQFSHVWVEKVGWQFQGRFKLGFSFFPFGLSGKTTPRKVTSDEEIE
jgi:hypothetical protein